MRVWHKIAWMDLIGFLHFTSEKTEGEKLKKNFFWRYLEKFGELYVVFKGLSFETNKTEFIFGVHARTQFLLEFSVV